jgi:hypothetical protein
MCEPSHSIVQYPDSNPDDHLPMGDRLKQTLGERIVAWGKRIQNWFHFSKLGSGHSDAIELSGRSSLILPEHTRYEGLWWDRDFKIDGSYHGFSTEQADAFETAKYYHDEKVMKNMSTFRRFLETSIEKSDSGQLYMHQFAEHVLTKEGRDGLYSKLKRLGKSLFTWQLFRSKETKEKATKILMGFTRKRILLLPHWADDEKLWTPGQVG